MRKKKSSKTKFMGLYIFFKKRGVLKKQRCNLIVIFNVWLTIIKSVKKKKTMIKYYVRREVWLNIVLCANVKIPLNEQASCPPLPERSPLRKERSDNRSELLRATLVEHHRIESNNQTWLVLPFRFKPRDDLSKPLQRLFLDRFDGRSLQQVRHSLPIQFQIFKNSAISSSNNQ